MIGTEATKGRAMRASRQRAAFARALPFVEVVSFDVFGTLLTRGCARASTIFDLAFARWSGEPLELGGAFSQVRATAGDEASAGHIQGLAEIYARMPVLSPEERERLMALEMECERTLLMPRPDVRELYELALSQGRRVVVTSDMYLPSAWLWETLAQCGYGAIERVFVSCEHGTDKAGGLLRVVSSELGVEPGRVLHVGDSLVADVRGARAAGVRALYVGAGAREKLAGRATAGLRTGGGGSMLREFAPAEALATEGRGDPWALGYRALGPLLVGFCEWCHGQARPGSQLFFLARDAKLLMSAYLGLYPEDAGRARYLHVSRRTLNSVALSRCETMRDVGLAVGLPRMVSPATFSSAAGIAGRPEVRGACEGAGLRWEEVHEREGFLSDARLAAIEPTVLGAIREEADLMRASLASYLAQQGMGEGSCVVDVGWHGSAQRALEAALGARLTGLYFGTNTTSDLDARGLLYDDGAADGDALMAGYWGLFESLFATGDGITTGYRAAADGQVEHVEGAPELGAAHLEVVRQIQKGAMAFVAWYGQTLPRGSMGEEGAREAMHRIARLAEHPSMGQARLYGSIPFLDFGAIAPIVREPRRAEYLGNPSLVREDFFGSTWRIAYLRRLFALPADYAALFRVARAAFRAGGAR